MAANKYIIGDGVCDVDSLYILRSYFLFYHISKYLSVKAYRSKFSYCILGTLPQIGSTTIKAENRRRQSFPKSDSKFQVRSYWIHFSTMSSLRSIALCFRRFFPRVNRSIYKHSLARVNCNCACARVERSRAERCCSRAREIVLPGGKVALKRPTPWHYRAHYAGAMWSAVLSLLGSAACIEIEKLGVTYAAIPMRPKLSLLIHTHTRAVGGRTEFSLATASRNSRH